MKDGKRNGVGIYYFNDYSVYIGKWISDFFEDQLGHFFHSNGDLY